MIGRMEDNNVQLGGAATAENFSSRLHPFLMEENEDRLAAFLETHQEFSRAPVLNFMEQSGLLTEEGKAALQPCVTPDGAIRITPDKIRADGFFVAALIKAA